MTSKHIFSFRSLVSSIRCKRFALPPRAASVPVPLSVNVNTRRIILNESWVLAPAPTRARKAARRLTQELDGFLERDRDRALFNPVSPRLLFLDHRRLDCVAHTVQFSLAVGFDKCVFCAKQRIGVYVHSVQSL